MPYTHDPEPDPPAIPKAGAPEEPLLTVGTLTAVAAALLAALVSFGIDISDNQQAKLLGLILVLAPFVVAGIGRLKAWSPASARRLALAERNKAQGAA